MGVRLRLRRDPGAVGGASRRVRRTAHRQRGGFWRSGRGRLRLQRLGHRWLGLGWLGFRRFGFRRIRYGRFRGRWIRLHGFRRLGLGQFRLGFRLRWVGLGRLPLAVPHQARADTSALSVAVSVAIPDQFLHRIVRTGNGQHTLSFTAVRASGADLVPEGLAVHQRCRDRRSGLRHGVTIG